MKWLLLITTVTILSCGGTSEPSSTLRLEDAEEGTADGEYLGDRTEVTVVSGDDGSYVFDGDDLEGATLEVDGKDVGIEEATKNDLVCQEENAQMDIIVVDGEIVDIICYLPPDSIGGDENYVELTAGSGTPKSPKTTTTK